jgi:hypothetical protein
MDRRILNAGLDLAMEFGEHWLSPIQERLAAKCPSLSAAELDAYNDACRAAMHFGHEQVALKIREAGNDHAKHFRRFRTAVLARYPWISAGNLKRLFSQGCYYAMK